MYFLFASLALHNGAVAFSDARYIHDGGNRHFAIKRHGERFRRSERFRFEDEIADFNNFNFPSINTFYPQENNRRALNHMQEHVIL